MTNPFLPGMGSLLFALLGALAPNPAAALVVQQNVNFAAVNRNPWTGGPAFENEWHLSQPSVGPVNVDLPRLNGSPLNIIADFLGVDLPVEANIGVGGSVSGRAGFDFGYYVSGGKLNVNYPALSTFNVQTTQPDNNRVLSGRPFSVGSQFTPGLNTVSPPLTPQYLAAAGAGYDVLLNPPFPAEIQAKDPFLTTTFPYASAWADFGYDIKAGAFVEARATVLGACIVCARKEVKFGDARDVRLIEIDPGGKGQPPSAYFLGNRVDPFQPIQIGPAKITFSYPDVAVQGALQGDRTLFGSDTRNIIAVQGGAEKLIPFIGPFLQNGVGPFGYELLSTDGGPTLGLYQEFRFTPQPRARLAFSQPVLQRGADGQYHATNIVEFELGQNLDLIAPLNLNTTTMRVQPTYLLHNTVYNETGLSLGVQMDIEMLKLNSSFGDLGPAFDDRLVFELARMKLFGDDFSLNIGQVTGRPFELDVIFPINLVENRYELVGVQPTRTEGLYAIAIRDLFTDGFTTFLNVTGTELGFDPGDDPLSRQKILFTDADVFFNGINIGRSFCLLCLDASSALFLDESGWIALDEDGDERLYLTDLTDFPSGEIDITDHPILGTNNFRDDHRPVPTEIGPTVFVAEPGTLALSTLALLMLAGTRRSFVR